MNKTKIILPIALLLGLVLIGGMCTQSSESFYKKVCKATVELEEGLEDFMDDHSDYPYKATYDDVDDCIEESIENEEDVYDDCMDREDDDEEECNRMIEDIREYMAKSIERARCEDSYEEICKETYGDDDDDFDECIDDVINLCKAFPKKF